MTQTGRSTGSPPGKPGPGFPRPQQTCPAGCLTDRIPCLCTCAHRHDGDDNEDRLKAERIDGRIDRRQLTAPLQIPSGNCGHASVKLA
ncbi:hypothetical protein ANAPC5_01406 [Anaplasma phagocytophilum]|nr:hypothetical protein ANAPC5_01406 [Anaplasma phagocytophilum]